jgi:DNA-binding CsgD family transcriptional regulator
MDHSHALVEIIHSLNTAPSPSDFCKNLVHGLLTKEQAFAANIQYLGGDSRFQILGAYGYTQEQAIALESSVWSDSPAAQSIRTKQAIALENDTAHHLGDKSYNLVVPIYDSLSPLGCLAMEFAKPCPPEFYEEAFQRILNLAGIIVFNRFVSRNQEPTTITESRIKHNSDVELTLTKRQIVVLRGIREELSNAQIAAQLNLSESSIKQETVRLFRALGVKNRSEARLIGLKQSEIR